MSILGSSCSASLWSSQNSVDSLRTSNLSFYNAAIPTAQGLEDIIRTVQSLKIRLVPSSAIRRGTPAGEGETFWVERCDVSGQTVAVKHLKVDERRSVSNEFRHRIDSLLLEMRIMHHAPLSSHPNILNLIGYGWNIEAGGILPYILVEYSAEGTLRQYLRRRRDVRLETKEMLIADVGAGLHALHVTGIVHGDVKLENVLVFYSDERQSSPIAKICDFGHSILVGTSGDETSHGIYKGTPRYHAPEVLEQKANPIKREELKKCDIWAFGLLAWEIVLDGAVYTDHIDSLDSSPAAILSSALRTTIRSTRDTVIQGVFRRLFKRTLEADPNLRAEKIDNMACMARWKRTGTANLSAQLALHTGNSEWSFEVFRFETRKDIAWIHREHIAQEFIRVFTTTDEDHVKASAAWQIAVCHATGFGLPADWKAADRYWADSSRLGSGLAQRFRKPLSQAGREHTGELYASALRDMLSLDAISSSGAFWLGGGPLITASGGAENADVSSLENAIKERDIGAIIDIHEKNPSFSNQNREPPLIMALRARNSEIAGLLSDRGCSPETQDESGRNAFHWLFMLGDRASTFAKRFRGRAEMTIAVNTVVTNIVIPDPQWPLQLEGSPLAHAVATGSADTVAALLDLGANPLQPAFGSEGFAGWTPLHVAVKYHHAEILQLLLEHLDSRKTISDLEIPLALVLPDAPIIERVAMHGKKQEKHLTQTIELLGEPKCLERAAKDGTTPLMRALDNNDLQVTTALLKRHGKLAELRSVSPSPTDEFGHDPQFHYAIHHAVQLVSCFNGPKSLDLMKLIQTHDIMALDRRDSQGRTPAHVAAAGYNHGGLTFLIDQKPSLLHEKDTQRATPLHYCETATVAEHLVSLGAKIDARDRSGHSALHYAVIKGYGTIVQSLCKLNATIDFNNSRVENPLHVAIRREDYSLATTLVAFGASINARDEAGNNALHIAAKKSPHHVLDLLLDNGANPMLPNNEGKSALDIAVRSGNAHAIDVLSTRCPGLILMSDLSKPGIVNQKVPNSPLYVCSRKFNKAAFNQMLVRMLKKDAESLDRNGFAVIHYAAKAGDMDVIQSLIRVNANLDIRDSKGNTALMLTMDGREFGMKRPQLFQMLLGNGANPTISNNARKLPWNIAAKRLFDESQDDVRHIMRMLLDHSVGACCQDIRRTSSNWAVVRIPYEEELTRLAFNRRDERLKSSLKCKISHEVYSTVQEEYRRAKLLEEAKKRDRAERDYRESLTPYQLHMYNLRERR
ncbi:unnamed protein product [Periconia digitata]|uniref:Protein kinase domain-containing protein n=1 Tax=Periconia digitata TaxID=1303443 RepID=A0A9W4XU85_9PLEO|nr:unnamed protein product [Periconia digitata]